MPEQNQQITPEQIALMVDIIGGLAGQYASSLLQTNQQPQVKSSPYHWKRFFTKARPPVRPTRPQAPNPQPVKPPEVKVPPNPKPTASSGQPSRQLDFTPPQKVQAPPPQPPEDQHQILEEVKKESQNHLKPYGTELAHWTRVRQISESILSQYEAVGVNSLDRLIDILSNEKFPRNATNLTLFHDDTSPFVLLSQPGQNLATGGIPAVVVGYPYANQVHHLEAAFPGIHFMTSEEAPKEIEEAARSLKKPLPQNKSYRTKDEEGSSSPAPQQPKQEKPSTQKKPQKPVSQESTMSYVRPQSQQPQQEQQTNFQDPSSFQPEGAPVEIDLASNARQTQEYSNQIAPPPQKPEPRFPEPKPITPEEGERLVSEYVAKYTQTLQAPEANYNRELPDDQQVDAGEFELLSIKSRHGDRKSIGKVTVNGEPSFYKTVDSDENAQMEVLATDLGKIAGVAVPNARVLENPKTNAFGTPVLFSWIEGPSLMKVSDNFIPEDWRDGKEFLKSQNAPLLLSVLEKITRPGEIDRLIFYSFLVGLNDRHMGNQIVSGDRIVSIDAETRRNEAFSPSLMGVTNNFLFVIKLAQNSREWNEESMVGVQLDPKIAGEMAAVSDKMAQHLQQSGVDQDEVQALLDRGHLLREFSRSGDNTFGTMLKIFRETYPHTIAI